MGFSTFEIMLIKSAIEDKIETIKKGIEVTEDQKTVCIFKQAVKYYEELLEKCKI